MEEAAATGAQIEISVADLATHVAGTPLAEHLTPHLRIDPDAMSVDEAKAFLQTDQEGRHEAQGASDRAEAQASAADTAERAQGVRDHVLGQLTETNRFTAPVNRGYADLVGSYYSATAERLGMTPDDLFKAYPVRFAAERLDSEPAFAGHATDEAARGAYSPDTRTVSILKNADLSTTLHELGHAFFDTHGILAARDDAPPQVRADFLSFLDHAGVEGGVEAWHKLGVDGQRTAHEKFAVGFEKYLMEGKAPSLEMQGLFTRFRSWMLNVYEKLTNLRVELTPEVRGVFDRMLASDRAIESAQVARSHAPLFESAERAGMTPTEFHQYEQTGARASADAVANLDSRLLSDMRWQTNAQSKALRARQREVDGLRAAMREQVAREVEAEPVNRAARFLKDGETTDPDTGEQIKATEGHKLDRAAIDALYPESSLGRPDIDKLRGMTAKDGIDPDVAAEIFGFSSGDHLIRSIVDREDPRAKIDGLTDQRLLEAYGDVQSKASLQRAAEESIANDARSRMLSREANALSKAVGNKTIVLAAAREFAAKSIAGKRVAAIRPALYRVAEARAGREAAAAFKKGDTAAAAGFKREQMLDNELQRAASNALEEIDRKVAYLKKFDSPTVRSLINKNFRDQIDGLLEKVDLRTSVSAKDLARRQSLSKWIEGQRENSFEPLIPDSLLDDAQRKSFKEMTLEEVRGLVDAVKNIEHLGRLKTRLLTDRENREFGAVVDSIAQTIVDNGGKKRDEQRTSDRGFLVAPKRIFREFVSSHRKFASFARQFDGWTDGGATWEHLVRNMNKAGDDEAVAREQATTRLLDMMKGLDDGRLKRKTDYREAGKSFTGEERISMALHLGNETNRERLMTGEKLTESAVHAIVSDLTPAEAKFVNDTWALLESYRPQIGAKELRVNGVEPTWVEAQPFTLHLKTGESIEMTGGYYPIKSDSLRSERAAADANAVVAQQMTRGLYARAQTARGHLKDRVESTGRPLRYDLNVIPEHLAQVTHDLAWHEYLIDATRLLRSERIETAVRDHYGVEPLQQLKSTLTDIAVGDAGAQSGLAKTLNYLRIGTTVSGLALNVTNSLINLTGFSQSMVRIGPTWAARGMVHWMGDAMHLESSAAKINEMSPMMRLRAKTMQRELNEVRNRISGSSTKLERARSMLFVLQTVTQKVVDIPTWWGAYEKAMATPEMDEPKAIALADQAVIDSQGGGQTKDLSAVQRGEATQKLLTAFYSFANTTMNLTTEAVGKTNFRQPGSVLTLAMNLALLYAVPSLAQTIVNGAMRGDLDDPDRLKRHAMSDLIATTSSTMVGLRELTGARQALAGVGGGTYTGPASLRFISDVTKLAKATNKDIEDGEVTAAALHAATDVGGILFHLPAAQIDRTAAGIKALHDGETKNLAVLLSGPKSKN